jgi:hypothetical protein
MAKELIGTARFTAEVGVFVRGQFRRLLNEVRFMKSEVSITVKEDAGWLSSTFYVTITGPESKMLEAVTAIRHATKDLE